MGTAHLVALIVDGSLSLVLAVVGCVLFALHHRPYVLCWSLAAACLAGAIFLTTADASSHTVAPASADPDTLLRDAALACAAAFAALWLLGVLRFRNARLTNADDAPTSTGKPPARGWGSVAGWTLAAAVAGGSLSRAAPYAVGDLLPGAAAAVVYGWCGFLFVRTAGLRRERGVWMLGAFGALAGLAQLAGVFAARAADLTNALLLVNGFAQCLTSLALLVLVFDEREAVLRDALHRLDESETHLQLLFQHSGVGMALLSPDGRFLRVNPALEQFVGFTGEELIQRRLVDLAHPDDTRHGVSPSEQGVNLPNDLYERERRYTHKQGHTVWARVLRVPLRDKAGRMRYLVAVLIDITERRKAELALAASEQRYRLRFEGAFDGILCCQESGEFLEANPAFCRMLGYTEKEVQGLTVIEIADDLPQMRRHFQVVLAHGSHRCETRLRCKDGRRVDVEISSAALVVDDRRLVLGVTHDVTERKQAVEALRLSEERRRIILGTSLDALILLDGAGRIVEFNGAAEAMFRRRSGDVVGQDLAELLLPPDLRATHREGLECYLRTGRSDLIGRRVEWEAQRSDGQRFPIELAVNPIHQGEQTLFVSFIRDITDRRRAEETLREERDFSTQVLETADVLLVVLDPAGGMVRWNGKCAAVLGCGEEVCGLPFWKLPAPARFAEAAREQFLRVAADPAPVAFEAPWTTAGGEEQWIVWRYAAVRDGQGRVRYVIGAGLDETDHRRLEDQLRHSQKMETLGRLVGGIAHDFNNQLTVILGNLELALAGGDERCRDELIDADRAARRCADMTQGLLTFGRQRVGQTRTVHLNHLVAEAVRLLQRVLPATIGIEIRSQADLWTVSADSTQLHQVLMNLAVNARDAMPDGGALTLETSNRVIDAGYCARNVEARPGPFVVLSVTDDGVGMTPDVQSRVFEPFYTTKPVGQGTGLGLAIVFGIVKGHHGWITMTSEVGRGSAFQVFLPKSEAPARKELILAQPPAPNGGREGVLVVDDEQMVRHLARSVLERKGYRVLTAVDGLEALRIYEAQTAVIDLVLLDYTMPGMTGLQVFHKLREINPAVRVIFSSGHTMDSDSEVLLAAGGRAFVAKPYRVDDLVRRVRQVLDETAPVGQEALRN